LPQIIFCVGFFLPQITRIRADFFCDVFFCHRLDGLTHIFFVVVFFATEWTD